jgi:hypothetical protein
MKHKPKLLGIERTEIFFVYYLTGTREAQEEAVVLHGELIERKLSRSYL